jgi:hypothetical protein
LIERDHLHFAVAGASSERLEIELAIPWDNYQVDSAAIASYHQRLENLFRRHADFSCYGFSGKVVWIHIVFAQSITDAQTIEYSGCVGLHDFDPAPRQTGFFKSA